MFFIMAAVNILLICVMRKRKNSTLNRSSSDDFKKESCTLNIMLFFFELSYLFRFFWDQYLHKIWKEKSFAYRTAYDVSLYIDVLPFIALLLFHWKNFK